ncbi:leucine-rich repeat-containing protein 74A-like isoform X1 [Lates japonicus]|uniref:Leucine-rich repeat-containing protein 74A-like isoform X1 n=1 Tax=Lates japonicus TaxID=270547 RepID=A0AAD3R9H6_LATJO|nr:leucine-rich repeat-containing protein 74A-like isoform X1 [Lates japonicus]
MDEDEERRKRRREKNKVAAARCRNKKKERTDFLQRESERLEMVNSELKAQIEELRLERQQLMVMLNLHRPTCIVRTDSVKTPERSQDETQDHESPTQGQEQNSGEEWDTDLETGDAPKKRQNLPHSELYLQACQQTGTVPVSSFFHLVDEPNVNLNHYGVGPMGAKALAIALQFNTDITNLELEDNALQAQGTRYLMEMLQTNISIQSLNLSKNQLHLEGADIISKMLLDNYYIKSIKLSGNEFDDSAAKYFADTLKGDYVVKELDLSHNKFCEAGGEHLGHMLATNVGIEVLNLSWNHIRMRGAVALSAGLKLSCNPMTNARA